MGRISKKSGEMQAKKQMVQSWYRDANFASNSFRKRCGGSGCSAIGQHKADFLLILWDLAIAGGGGHSAAFSTQKLDQNWTKKMAFWPFCRFLSN
jgi:hypothetical protein